MRERLPEDRDELDAGKIGAGIFLSDYRKREELLSKVPEKLKERAIGIIMMLEEQTLTKRAYEISCVKKRKDRVKALNEVPLYYRGRIKEMVIKLFKKRITQ